MAETRNPSEPPRKPQARSRRTGRCAFWLVGGVTALGLLGGCASVAVQRPDDSAARELSIDEFKDYVEQVFRYQNRVVDELIAYYSFAGIDGETPGLIAAEEASINACQPLNRVISRYIAGDTPAFSEKRALVASIGDCEYHVERLDAALAQFQLATAD